MADKLPVPEYLKTSHRLLKSSSVDECENIIKETPPEYIETEVAAIVLLSHTVGGLQKTIDELIFYLRKNNHG